MCGVCRVRPGLFFVHGARRVSDCEVVRKSGAQVRAALILRLFLAMCS